MSKQSNNTPIPLIFKVLAGTFMVFAVLLGISLITRLFSYETVAQFWPIVVILVGLVMVSTGQEHITSGALVTILGAGILALKMDWLGSTGGRYIEVALLVLLGLVLLTITASKYTKPQ